ncbi:MAG: hypothetical protein DI536_36255 [Archangium gephyra]|uniref:YggT family protein n=1 Tax=Archangium gephyra TaxID=48 RepID=A0A2W5SUQ9_9BACT|nr:MAG: hypothetical protein DI536_36255 [Archangium gephyra]
MGALSVVAGVLYSLLVAYLVAMWVRFALDLVLVLSREWRPRGVLLVIAEFVYTITDPPIRLVRRVIPPLRVGGAALDFAWTVVMLAVIILMTIVSAFAGGVG